MKIDLYIKNYEKKILYIKIFIYNKLNIKK